MTSWNIIGWFIICVASVAVFSHIVAMALTFLACHAMHTRTRDDEPKPGDQWIEGRWIIPKSERGLLTIKRIADNGRIVIESGLPGGSRLSWSDSPDEWKARVKNRKLWRSRP